MIVVQSGRADSAAARERITPRVTEKWGPLGGSPMPSEA